MKHPQFGDWLLNTAAGESNPHRVGIFVRVARDRDTRHSKGATWYELTDGHGKFWKTDPRVLVPTKGPQR